MGLSMRGPTAMTADTEPIISSPASNAPSVSWRLAPFPKIVLVSHVNPDPNALASMLGLKAMIDHSQPGEDRRSDL